MIKLFVTGDIHFGKKFDRYPEVRDRLIQSRFDCLKRSVEQAENEGCDFFVIAGDLFDNVNKIGVKEINRVVDILSAFNGRVVVLPGNHDYYTGEEKVWKDFKNALDSASHGIILAAEFKELRFDVGEESVTFYPAFCQSKHAKENNLGWIRAAEPDDSTYHVGLAHGALAGLSPDMKNEYFLMTEKELNEIPMDAWIIGHTHIPYPPEITAGEVSGYRIYNAGTPEQTDLSNKTPGLCFVVTLDREDGDTKISAHAYQSGAIWYYDLALQIDGDELKPAILSAIRDLPDAAVIRLTLKGTVSGDEYEERQKTYKETLGRFLTYEVADEALCEQISREKIRSEFAEIGFAAKLLEALTDPKEVQMVYELVRKYRA